jgi:hypothetical protein
MAYSDAKLLEITIQTVREYHGQRPPVHLEQLFYRLNECDQSRHNKLWEELKTALRQNQALATEAPATYLDRPRFIEKGYWWWDSSLYGAAG